MLDYKDITASVTKSDPDEFGNFFVTISGSAEGEPYTWALDGLHTEESWALQEKQRIREFKKQVMSQFE